MLLQDIPNNPTKRLLVVKYWRECATNLPRGSWVRSNIYWQAANTLMACGYTMTQARKRLDSAAA